MGVQIKLLANLALDRLKSAHFEKLRVGLLFLLQFLLHLLFSSFNQLEVLLRVILRQRRTGIRGQD
jgi:hypothetical protein